MDHGSTSTILACWCDTRWSSDHCYTSTLPCWLQCIMYDLYVLGVGTTWHSPKGGGPCSVLYSNLRCPPVHLASQQTKIGLANGSQPRTFGRACLWTWRVDSVVSEQIRQPIFINRLDWALHQVPAKNVWEGCATFKQESRGYYTAILMSTNVGCGGCHLYSMHVQSGSNGTGRSRQTC